MIIIYFEDSAQIGDCRLIRAISNVNALVESGGNFYVDELGKPVSTSDGRGWIAVPEQVFTIPIQYYADEIKQAQIGYPLISELNLVYYTPETLPVSSHYAQVTAILPFNDRPLTVRRWFSGQWYDDIRCLVTEAIKQLWLDGGLGVYDIGYPWDAPENEDTIVIVNYIPDPQDPNKEIPIVTEKVYKSW